MQSWALARTSDTALWRSCNRCSPGLSVHKAAPSANDTIVTFIVASNIWNVPFPHMSCMCMDNPSKSGQTLHRCGAVKRSHEGPKASHQWFNGQTRDSLNPLKADRLSVMVWTSQQGKHQATKRGICALPALVRLFTYSWGQLLLCHVFHKHWPDSRLLRQGLSWAHHQQSHSLQHEQKYTDSLTRVSRAKKQYRKKLKYLHFLI